MSLYPGAPRIFEEDGEEKHVLDNLALDDATALDDSLAKAIEEAMDELFLQIKKEPIPDTGAADRRLLFVAIARGIFQYLATHQNDIDGSVTIGPDTHTVNINLNIKMNKESTTPCLKARGLV